MGKKKEVEFTKDHATTTILRLTQFTCSGTFSLFLSENGILLSTMALCSYLTFLLCLRDRTVTEDSVEQGAMMNEKKFETEERQFEQWIKMHHYGYTATFVLWPPK